MDDKTHALQWEVPLSQFYVDQSLYHPKPTLWSPITTIETEGLLLKWQLSLEQGRSDAEVFVHHRTPNLPNQGVNYTVFALSQNGTTSELTHKFTRALNQLAETRYKEESCEKHTSGITEEKSLLQNFRDLKTTVAKKISTATGPSAAIVEQLVWPGYTVKLRIILGLNNALWSPHAVLCGKVALWLAREPGLDANGHPGMLDRQLWSQVRQIPPKEEVAELLECTDLIFVCPKGERIVAHKPVVAGFSQPIFNLIQTASTGGKLTVNLPQMEPEVLMEMLHFMYLRHVSLKFHYLSATDLLQAARFFELPAVVMWEAEKTLVHQLNRRNKDEMSALVNTYGSLKVLQNMIRKMNRDADEIMEYRRNPKLLSNTTHGFCMEV